MANERIDWLVLGLVLVVLGGRRGFRAPIEDSLDTGSSAEERSLSRDLETESSRPNTTSCLSQSADESAG